MNIQIFGARKSFDTKKAERWFKERRIKYQYIDLDSKGLSPGEYRSIRAAVGYDAWWTGTAPTTGSWGLTIFCPRRRRRSCWKTPGCSGRPSSATAARPPWATAPTCGNLGIRHYTTKICWGTAPAEKCAKNRSAPADLFFME